MHKSKPPITAGAHLLLSRLRVLRDKNGTEWCRKWGVGGIRRDLERELASHSVIPIGSAAEAVDPAMGHALSIAEAECRKCPKRTGCKMGRLSE